MTGLAERLPIRFVPEERGIAFVRPDVINLACRGDASSARALRTERVSGEEEPRGPRPSVVIPAGVSGAAPLVLGSLTGALVFVTEGTFSARQKPAAEGMGARVNRSGWHVAQSTAESAEPRTVRNPLLQSISLVW